MHSHFTKQTVSPKRNLALTQGSNHLYVEKEVWEKVGKKCKRILELLMSRNMSRNESQALSEVFKGAVLRNSAKLGNYKLPVELRET